VARHVRQIGAVFAAVDNRNGHQPRLRLKRLALLPPALQLLNRIPRHLLRMAQDHGNIVHPRYRIQDLFVIRQSLSQAPDTL
jgi:hypothetical protein